MVFPIETHFRFLFFAILRSVCDNYIGSIICLKSYLYFFSYKNLKCNWVKPLEVFLCIGFSSWDLIMLFVFSYGSNLQFMDILFRESHVIAFRLKEMGSIAFWSLLWLYLYFGSSSLCLYNITMFLFFQDGILSKLTKLYLCNIQICVYCGHFALTSVSRYDMIIMLGGL